MRADIIGVELFTVVFVMTVVFTGILLPILQKRRAGQYILEIGPSWHKSKEGTPTMGGLAPFAAVLLTGTVFLIFMAYSSDDPALAPFVLTVLYALANACIGFFDDMTKLSKKRNAGLTPWQKMILQITFATAYVILLIRYNVITTDLPIPFTTYVISLGYAWYPLSILFLVWFVNCANLTDGIDGLASSIGAVIGLGFFILAIRTSSLSLSLCSSALLGGALGFFVYNRHPAKIFMGDTGSLFFGALAVGCSMIYGSPLTMFLFGIVYLIEGVTVVLQVLYFKITHGKRLFRMAPFHHHLEKSGWSEWQIVICLSLVTILSILLAFLGVHP